MATPTACAELIDVLPRLLRARRGLVGDTPTTVAVLSLTTLHGPLRISEIAERLGLDMSTVSRQTTQLRARGLLEIGPDPDDGRSHRCSPTPAGIEELRHHRRALVDRLVGRLHDWDDADVHELTVLLARFASPETEELRKA